MSTPEDPNFLARQNPLQSDTTARASEPAGTQNASPDAASPSRPIRTAEERAQIRAERARVQAERAQALAQRNPARALAAKRGTGHSAAEADLLTAERRNMTKSNSETAPPEPEHRDSSRLHRVLELKPLPQKDQETRPGVLISFIVCVLLPIIAASIYYFGFASKQYVSEFKFVVRDSKSAAAANSAPAGVQSLIGMGISGGANSAENYMMAEYLLSREAVEALEKKVGLIAMYSQTDIDWVARLNPSAPIEQVVTYWNRMVTANYDQITGLGTTQIRAFTPEDAYKIASTLVQLSEELVNNVANRPQLDAVRFAEVGVRRAEERLQNVRAALSRYRNAEQLIEPQADLVMGKVTLAQTLRANLAALETELSVLKGQNVSATSPQSIGLQNRIKSTREQLKSVESQVATARDGYTPLSKVVAEYEHLDMERQFAQNMLNAELQNLEQARANARVQHVYVTAFVAPAVPQSATYPKRITSVLLVALGCMLFWTIGLLIIGSVREHLT